MARNLDDFIKKALNDRYEAVLQSLRDNKEAIEEMTAELLEIEVISGERVREIIKANGGTVFEEEDLHSDAINEEDTQTKKDTEKTDKKSDEKENTDSLKEEKKEEENSENK
jgi:cell division protease FtsH